MTAPHETAALSADVNNLKDQHAALRGEVRDVKADMASGFASIRHSLDTSLGGLRQAIDAKTSTNWTPIAIAVAAFTAITGTIVSASVAIAIAFYGGLRAQAEKHETAIERLADRQLPRVEFERGQQNTADDLRVVGERLRKNTDALDQTRMDLSYIKGQLNPLPVRPKE